MYNLSRTRVASGEWKEPESVDPKFSQEHDYHVGMMKSVGREQALQTLGNHYTLRAFVENGEDPASVSLKDLMREYYYYLKEHDPEFLDKLGNLSGQLINKFVKDPKSLDEAMKTTFPPVPQPAAPVGMGAMASTHGLVSMAGNSVYLNRDKGYYLLKDTLVGRILSGKAQYLGPDGDPMILAIDGNVAVRRNGPAARMAFRTHEEMPGAMAKAASEALSGAGMSDGDVYRSVIRPYLDNGSFDLRPVSTRIGGADLGYMLYSGVPGVKEPEKVESLRRAIGKVMGDMVDRLKSALLSEGISVKSRTVRTPGHLRGGPGSSTDRHPTRDPRPLSADETETSLDVQSMVMTIANRDAGPELKTAAIDRLVEVMSNHPEAYAGNELSETDIQMMARSSLDPAVLDKMERLLKFSRLFDGTDEDLVKAYSSSDPGDQSIIASMAAKQGRKDVIKVNPYMAIQEHNEGYRANPAFVAALDPSDEDGMDVIRFAVSLVADRKMKPTKALSDKAMQALYEEGDAELLEHVLGTSMPARDFALLAMMERGGDEDKSRAILEMTMTKTDGAPGKKFRDLLFVSSVIRNIGNDESLIGSMSKKFSVSPNELSLFTGKQGAQVYMRASRRGWEGGELPSASDIYSLTDDPMPLLKNYYDLAQAGDKDAMAALRKMHHLMSDEINGGEADPYLQYSFGFARDALSSLGEDVDVLDRLVSESKEPALQPMVASMLPDGSVMTKKGGVYQVPGVACFSCSPSDAIRIAVCRIAESRSQRGLGNDNVGKKGHKNVDTK